MLKGERPSIGLALGGGGIRGIVHIGILEVFEQHEVPIDVICGSSAGGLIGGLYSVGCSIQELKELAFDFKEGGYFNLHVDPIRVLKILLKILIGKLGFYWAEMPKGVIVGRDIERFLCWQTEGKYFDQTEIPIAITATDIKTGELIVFTEGRLTPLLQGRDNEIVIQGLDDDIFIIDCQLAQAIRASISIPGLFVPVELDNRLLVDGGLKNNVPADILAKLNVDLKLAVDLGFEIQDDDSIRNLFDMLLQSFDIVGQEVTDLKLKDYADLVIKPDIGKVSLTDVDKIPYLLEIGREVGRDYVYQIKESIEEFREED
ncbi:patatin-like phospholipase family protein [Acetohalobium arabaticum]|uniref:Patatin n=1 Tax=Acetohalobium arabaticum (strain ATCC 49924 / DSM 5501 / Z-7288) TaxID=574087 RepID=D9QUJ9_ACEAZ|nr:patatin-like phospholipase family protein [Acetohalobium arabaticum]ADL13800.1 Patatin [Acetohalobium arabaticum DSM 5501]